METFLCVTIDCECDKGPGWRCQYPLSFEGVKIGIQERLQPLFQYFGAKPTYLLSSEILRDEVSLEVLKRVHKHAELGSHLHGEFVEPGAFRPVVTAAFQRDLPRHLEAEQLRNLTNQFRSAFGSSPTSFRAGRFGIGQHSLTLLRNLGYVVDSSVTPHMDWSKLGSAGLSFRGAPTQPYFPDPRNPTIPNPNGLTNGICEVPVTIRPSSFARVPFLGSFLEPRWLRPTRGTVDGLLDVCREEISEAQLRGSDVAVLNCMFHNVEVIPKASPYAQNESQAKSILDRLCGLLTFAKRENISVVGLSEIPSLLDSHQAASQRGIRT